MSSYFAKHLISWHLQHPRQLPWTDGPRDPYHIWISEIIMQQTRIEQGASYYHRFIERFPDVSTLAGASSDEVMSQWQGLGYYTRARNLHAAAKKIMTDFNGDFPTDYEGILSLPGVGPYSAAAIASFAFHLPFPVVDGNVKRVVSRFAGIRESIDMPATHKTIYHLCAEWMEGTSPAVFNQAIMNFGALVCKPIDPQCRACPLSKKCFAFQHNLTGTLPVRSKKKINRERFFHFVLLVWKNKMLLMRRESKDIWNGLYTPLLLESASSRTPSRQAVKKLMETHVGHSEALLELTLPVVKQLLSHQTLFSRFYVYHLTAPPARLKAPYVWTTHRSHHEYGKPKMIRDVLNEIVW